MDVILLDKVGRLGQIGDKVTVKAGFGRNFLIPQGKAIPANDENVQDFEARRSEIEARANEKLGTARTRAESLFELSVTIAANAGEEGKLFGSIGTKDIADAITAAGVEVAKSEVKLPQGTLREVGEYDIDVQLHSDVTQSLKVTVVAE